MKQESFEARHGPAWQEFEDWVEGRETGKRRREASGDAANSTDVEFPQRYRVLCQHLALARDRAYSPALVDRLNRLALRGHHLLYGSAGDRRNAFLRFLYQGLPRQVRAESRLVWIAAGLLYGPMLSLALLVQGFPEIVHYLLDAAQVADIEAMYSPTAKTLGARGADAEFGMFGFYIWNNVKIGFQTFATGLTFGVGTVLFLLFNGAFIGTVAGHLVSVGSATPFFSFVSGHSAVELTAIVLSGAAGLKLGSALVAPGALTRAVALKQAGRIAGRIGAGAALLFCAAAFIEAFWSPGTGLPAELKYGVGVALWGLVLLYLWLPGRGHES